MEIFLAVIVVSAVILFGAMISIGNERQRKALDGLREMMSRWAIQDLKIKREGLARDVRIEDPIQWLNEVSRKVAGRELDLQIVETFDEPQALLCQASKIGTTVIFSPLSPEEVRALRSADKGKLDLLRAHPLFQYSTRWNVHELSVLNAGFLFDIELALAWQALTGQAIDGAEGLYMYFQG